MIWKLRVPYRGLGAYSNVNTSCSDGDILGGWGYYEWDLICSIVLNRT
jgi:hypothetical protein